MHRDITIAEVRGLNTRGGNVRWVVHDSDGDEYTTFRETIGAARGDLEGKRPRLPTRGSADEIAWQTAVAAAPWLVSDSESAVQPKRLYEKLKPFEECVAKDIEDQQRNTKSSGDAD